LTREEFIKELKNIEKDRVNIGADLALWRLIYVLIEYFSNSSIVEK
jgi:hypothetical protein